MSGLLAILLKSSIRRVGEVRVKFLMRVKEVFNITFCLLISKLKESPKVKFDFATAWVLGNWISCAKIRGRCQSMLPSKTFSKVVIEPSRF